MKLDKQATDPIKHTLLTWMDEAKPTKTKNISDEAIHQLRVCMKRQRAALQLYRHDASTGKKAQQIRDHCRALANSLAQSRDTRVMLKLLSQLNEIIPSASFKSLSHGLVSQKSHACNGTQIRGKWSSIKKEIIHQTWSEKETLKNIQQLLIKEYPKLQKQSLHAIKSSKPETLHACRKQIKQWCYQRELIDKQGQKDQQLKQLGHDFGAIHDIDMLREHFLLKNNIQTDDRSWLEQTTQQLRRTYLEQCLSLLQKQ